MTVAVAHAEDAQEAEDATEDGVATTPATDPTPVRLATWGARFGALALDVLPGLAVLTTTVLLMVTTQPGTWLRWTCVAVAGVIGTAMIVNRWVLPSVTGWTLGRAVCGIRVMRRDATRPGALRLALRDVAHLLDTAPVLLGWLWPLWDAANRTFADLLVRTEVRVVDDADLPERNVRRGAAWVLVAATVLCVGGAGLGYALVYQHDRAVETARTELSEQGPRIVEKLLSYSTETAVDDFATAQALATDGYRPQIIGEQQRIQQAGVVNNEFYAVSSAVLSPIEPDRGAMLLALQGQRGANANDLRFITATVRAEFEKIGGQWRVSGLTVLKKPLVQAPVAAAPPQAPSPSSAATPGAPAPPPPRPQATEGGG